MPGRPPDVDPDILQGDLTEERLHAYLSSAELAVDTETLGLKPLRDRLCLVQLCDRSRLATLVRIPRLTCAQPSPAPRLTRLLEAAGVLKVFHFARFDVATLKHHLGIEVAPLFCTRIASKLARTYTDRHGLKEIALELLDVEMDKNARHTDWSAETLTPEQIRYAISDVTMLLPLMDRLRGMLEREGRLGLASACFGAVPTLASLDLLGYDDLFAH